MKVEEKAKAYDEAYKKVAVRFGSNVADEIFHKESDDERIRKWLIHYFKEVCDNVSEKEKKGVLAWLEKQGEQKYIPKYKIGDYVKNTNYNEEPIYEIVYMDKECYICEYRGKERMGDKAVMHFSFDNPYLRLVQKPTDNVEPKFKVGDEIRTKNEESLIITRIDRWGYWSEDLFICNFDDSDKWELVEQNPAWSEEDEKIIQDIINDIAIAQEQVYCKSRCEDEINWLKSLKDRVLSKQEWSEEDENTLNAILTCYKSMDIKWRTWLKSLGPQNR